MSVFYVIKMPNGGYWDATERGFHWGDPVDCVIRFHDRRSAGIANETLLDGKGEVEEG